MATVKGKPRGYFEKILAFDCETTGLTFGGDDPSINHQALSWGFIIADAATLRPIEELYVEIKWDGESHWSPQAEKIHGMSKEYLEKNGVTEQDAVEQIGSLILRHWGPTVCVQTLGHNSITFDMWFLKRLMRKFGIELKFGNRQYDTNSMGWISFEIFNSDDLFTACGIERGKVHNALEDARCTLEAARRIRLLFKSALDG